MLLQCCSRLVFLWRGSRCPLKSAEVARDACSSSAQITAQITDLALHKSTTRVRGGVKVVKGGWSRRSMFASPVVVWVVESSCWIAELHRGLLLLRCCQWNKTSKWIYFQLCLLNGFLNMQQNNRSASLKTENRDFVQLQRATFPTVGWMWSWRETEPFQEKIVVHSVQKENMS